MLPQIGGDHTRRKRCNAIVGPYLALLRGEVSGVTVRVIVHALSVATATSESIATRLDAVRVVVDLFAPAAVLTTAWLGGDGVARALPLVSRPLFPILVATLPSCSLTLQATQPRDFEFLKFQ